MNDQPLNWTIGVSTFNEPAAPPPGKPPGGGNAFLAGLQELLSAPLSFLMDSSPGGNSGYVPPAQPADGAARPKTDVPLRGVDRAPGNGNAFFAGLEELATSPGSFLVDSSTFGDSGYVPPAKPGGGSAFVAGLEEAYNNPDKFFKDLPQPGSGMLTVWAVLGVVGILGVAYITHKTL